MKFFYFFLRLFFEKEIQKFIAKIEFMVDLLIFTELLLLNPIGLKLFIRFV
jgi:hypothetical protein